MKRNVIMCTLAGAALAVTGPALAKPGGGGGHGKGGVTAGAKAGGKMGGGASAGGPAATVGTDVSVGSSISTRGRGAGMGAAASGKGSVGAGSMGGGSAIDVRGSTSARSRATTDTSTGVTTRMNGSIGTQAHTQLTGVVDGMAVVDSGGATIGTVTGIHTVGSGKVRSVQVTLTDGQIITLAPNSLTVDGDVLATTSLTTNVNSQGAANANINGLVNASPNSALAMAGVTTLTGLETGLTVNNSADVGVGTVSQVFVNRSGAVVGIQVELDGGGTMTVPATSLSIDGGIVTTTAIDPTP